MTPKNSKPVMGWLMLAIMAIALAAPTVFGQTNVVEFPSLPDGSAWISGLTTIFVSAAGLGLGILGLRFVIRMIAAGLASRRAK